MDITSAKNGFENLKELFWEANRAFMEKTMCCWIESYLIAVCVEL